MRRRSLLACVATAALLSGCGLSEIPSPAPRCIDCTLREAAAIAGIRVGVAAAPTAAARTALILAEFDALSPEGELVWKVTEPGPDDRELGPAEAILDFAADHDLYTTVSHFVWDQVTGATARTPGWTVRKQ